MYEVALQLPIGFVIALTGALIPGPMMAFIIARTPESGPRTGTLAALGHVMVELVLLSMLALGFGLILQNFIVQSVIYLIGGVSLVALSIFTFAKIGRVRGHTAGVAKYPPIKGGVLFSTIFNPTVLLWWVAIGTVMLMNAWFVAGWLGATLWLVGHFSADIIWFSFVSYSVSKGKKFLGTSGHKIVMSICALILLIFGIIFLIQSLTIV